jgi:hypothetical protein
VRPGGASGVEQFQDLVAGQSLTGLANTGLGPGDDGHVVWALGEPDQLGPEILLE